MTPPPMMPMRMSGILPCGARCLLPRGQCRLHPRFDQSSTRRKSHEKSCFALLGAVAALAASASFAAYPDRPVKLIVPWAAGGDTDNIFRPFAPLLQKHLGQTVVIANVGGASGTKGAKEAKDSPADGYTLYAVHDYIHSTYYTGVADVQYTDFEPVCLITSTAVGAHREPEDAVEDLAGARSPTPRRARARSRWAPRSARPATSSRR